MVEGGEVEDCVVEIGGKCVDENGSLGRKKRIKEKEKWKRNYNEKIFSWNQNVKILEGQIPGIESRMRKSFGKVPESSEIQVSRNDPK